MTWYASQIYAEPLPTVCSLFAAHPTLAKGMFLLNHLNGHVWPKGTRAIPIFRHSLPPEGLLVVRELCALGTQEYNWHNRKTPQAISWDDVIGQPDTHIMSVNHRPIGGMGKVHYDETWTGVQPPSPFLKFLKDVSKMTGTVVSFYQHASAAGNLSHQEIAWVFGEEDCVYVNFMPDYDSISKLTFSGVSVIEKQLFFRDTVLYYALSHYSLELPSPYFAPHTRDFPWEQYKMTF